ncbi:enoyl-CoA hydratase-related protein [Amycolatopsis orientalis]|uniref:enoyl-CoA hydratase-related protein n=1 Tax=Amycolatopsis orientalis TaxID=31958 RepID=UPI0003A8C618|nr:enoyl-CoA hydratase-related protein [Amycolatopsis orientalis]
MLEYRNGTVVVRFRAGETDHLAAALAYAGPRPVVLTGTAREFAPDLGTGLRSALAAVRDHPAPVVAAVNGDAIGAGYELAEAADLRIMSGGVVHPAGWPHALGPAAAVAAGLVDLQCPPARLLSLAVRLAGHALPHAAA